MTLATETELTRETISQRVIIRYPETERAESIDSALHCVFLALRFYCPIVTILLP